MDRTDPLLQLLDEARVDERRSAREQERAIGRMAEDEATLAGTLCALAEWATTVTVRTTAGRTHRGVIVAVGDDCLALSCTSDAGGVYIRFHAVSSVRPGADAGPAAAGERRATGRRLVDVLALAAATRPAVTMVLVGGERVAGDLWSVGADMVTIALAGGTRRRCYVPADSVCEVAFGSG